MSALGTLVAILLWVWTQYLPGYVVGRALVPGARGMARHGLALVCGFSVVPLAIFLLSALADLPMDRSLIHVVVFAINALGLVWLTPWRSLDIGWRDTAIVTGVMVAFGLFLLFGFRAVDAGDVLTTIQHCLYVIALHGIHSHPSISLPLYDAMTDSTMHFLIHHETAKLGGLAQLLYEQRIGNVPVLGYPIAVLGMAGWYVSALHSVVLAVVCVYLAARELGARPGAAWAGALVFGWASNIFSAYYVNENYYALAMAAFVLWGALKPRLELGFLAVMGLVLGHVVGVRHTAVLFVPVAFAAALWQPGVWRERIKGLAVIGLCSLVTVAPWLYINWLMLGDAFTHPKVQPDSGGRVVTNQFAGHTFLFKPLNWPFTDQVVRTVWNPFPTFIWIPLLIIQSFGTLACSIMALGVWLGRRLRRAQAMLLLFFVPHTLAMCLLEGIDWEQVTYALPGLAALGVWLALGIDGLWTLSRPRLVAAAVGTALLAGGVFAVRDVDFPVDTRSIVAERGVDQPVSPPEVTPEQGQTENTRAVAARLTDFQLLPEMPVWRTAWARRLAMTMAGFIRHDAPPVIDELPVYPSGQVVVLSAYSKGVARQYDFELAPRPLRAANTPVRTAVWLHTVAFQLKAERLKVNVQRYRGHYKVALTRIGASTEAQDFTFRLNPWFPPIKSIQVTLDGEPFDGLRILPWGGTPEEGEQMFIVTNYPAEILDVQEVPFTIDGMGTPTNCGIWIFLADVDGSRIETLSPGGATDMLWHGATQGVLRIPKPIWAESLVLFSEPSCSDHIPQYGDRFGIVYPPFDANNPIELKLDGIW